MHFLEAGKRALEGGFLDMLFFRDRGRYRGRWICSHGDLRILRLAKEMTKVENQLVLKMRRGVAA